MPISEFEYARLEKLLQKFCEEQGPPAHLRDQLRWGFRVDQEKQTIELFEIRPHFMQKGKLIEGNGRQGCIREEVQDLESLLDAGKYEMDPL